MNFYKEKGGFPGSKSICCGGLGRGGEMVVGVNESLRGGDSAPLRISSQSTALRAKDTNLTTASSKIFLAGGLSIPLNYQEPLTHDQSPPSPAGDARKQRSQNIGIRANRAPILPETRYPPFVTRLGAFNP